MNTPNELLEARLNEVERERRESDESWERNQLAALTALLTRHLSAWLMAALGLTIGFADGRAVADGRYRDRTLRLYLEDDGWMLVVSGWRQPICMTYKHAELEDRLLGRLVELRADLDTAAADVEVPPALTGPELFTLRGYGNGIALDLAGASTPRWFSDVERGLSGWLNDYVAPIIQAAQMAVSATYEDNGALARLDDALDHFEEALS
jgi:hypothetical protein